MAAASPLRPLGRRELAASAALVVFLTLASVGLWQILGEGPPVAARPRRARVSALEAMIAMPALVPASASAAAGRVEPASIAAPVAPTTSAAVSRSTPAAPTLPPFDATAFGGVVLDARTPDFPGRVTLAGRCSVRTSLVRPEVSKEDDTTRPLEGASVSLYLSTTSAEPPLSDEDARRVGALAGPGMRGAVVGGLTDKMRRSWTLVAHTESLRDGSFTFFLDRRGLPDDASFRVIARAEAPGAKLGGRYSGSFDRSDLTDLGTVSLQTLTVASLVVRRAGHPLEGASIAVSINGDELDYATDTTGAFELEEIAQSLQIVVSAPGCATRTCQVEEGATLRTDVDMEEAAPPTAVRVLGPSGAPIAKAQVSASLEGNTLAKATTDESGRAILSGLVAGKEYSLSASGPDSMLAGDAVATPPCPETTITLAAAGELSVAATLDPRLPRTFATRQVFFFVVENEDGVRSCNGASGIEARIGSLKPGTCRVSAHVFIDSRVIAHSTWQTVEVVAGASTRVVLPLEPLREVHGWVMKGDDFVDAEIRCVEASYPVYKSSGEFTVCLPESLASATVEITLDSEKRTVAIAAGQTHLGTIEFLPESPPSSDGR